MSIESAIYTVLAAAIAAAADDDALFEAELHDTMYEEITKPFGVRIGDAAFDLAPGPGGVVEEYDVLGKVQIFARVENDTPEAKAAAREKVRAIGLRVAGVLFENVTLGGETNDSRILGGQRDWANVQTVKHAVQMLYLIANETGAEQ